jgi:catechol 2,3-dioxygenase-like lactoylglutathione lyase family enzyme
MWDDCQWLATLSAVESRIRSWSAWSVVNRFLPMATDTRIRLRKTAFVVYNHPDLTGANAFLVDFGLTEVERHDNGDVFYKGYGSEPFCYWARRAQDGEPPSFGGAAYAVEDRGELDKAARLPGSTHIQPLNAPGGGEIVTVTDPLGYKIHLVWGQTEKAVERHLAKLVPNFEDEKPRKGAFHRLSPGPAPVHKWGHYGVTYPPGMYDIMFEFYTKTFTLAPSDVLHKDDRPVVCFFHIDRGLEYTDHHSFFIKPAKPGQHTAVAHSAFEVHDFDVQQLGHDFLLSKGYELCWGIGRHVLGSQIFDYWFDKNQFVLEHYADGDLVNSETPVSTGVAGPQSLKVWGPPVHPVF